MSLGRKYVRERLQLAKKSLDESQNYLAQAYSQFAQYGEYYGKYKEYLTGIAQTIEMAKEYIDKLLEVI